MAEKASVAEFWVGEFSYSNLRQPAVSFLAQLQDSGGRLTGTTTGRDTKSSCGGLLRGIIDGTRTERIVFFVKAYDGSSRLSHGVDYSGDVSEDGLLANLHA